MMAITVVAVLLLTSGSALAQLGYCISHPDNPTCRLERQMEEQELQNQMRHDELIQEMRRQQMLQMILEMQRRQQQQGR